VERVITVEIARHEFAALSDKKTEVFFSIRVCKAFLANVSLNCKLLIWIYIEG
jgi:hypothetical protein